MSAANLHSAVCTYLHVRFDGSVAVQKQNKDCSSLLKGAAPRADCKLWSAITCGGAPTMLRQMRTRETFACASTTRIPSDPTRENAAEDAPQHQTRRSTRRAAAQDALQQQARQRNYPALAFAFRIQACAAHGMPQPRSKLR
eukprot:3788855-Pleurochrysis_carterae.AAC.2